MGVTPDGWVTTDTQLRAYITNESGMLDILILRKEEPEIQIHSSLQSVNIYSLQLSLIMYSRNLVSGVTHTSKVTPIYLTRVKLVNNITCCALVLEVSFMCP